MIVVPDVRPLPAARVGVWSEIPGGGNLFGINLQVLPSAASSRTMLSSLTTPLNWSSLLASAFPTRCRRMSAGAQPAPVTYSGTGSGRGTGGMTSGSEPGSGSGSGGGSGSPGGRGGGGNGVVAKSVRRMVVARSPV